MHDASIDAFAAIHFAHLMHLFVLHIVCSIGSLGTIMVVVCKLFSRKLKVHHHIDDLLCVYVCMYD